MPATRMKQNHQHGNTPGGAACVTIQIRTYGSMPNAQLEIRELPLSGALEITFPRFEDERGYFSIPFNKRDLVDAGIEADFIQDNQSLSRRTGTVRGLHYQAPPFAQAKLVRVLQGRILDVMVDAREGSPTFGQHCCVELDAASPRAVFVPRGFLHGFVTRQPNTVMLYKVDNDYAAGHDGSVRWDDSELGIEWELSADDAVLSDKDAHAIAWADFKTPFRYPMP